MPNNNLARKVGLWLDHSKAHFVDFSKGPVIVETAYSGKESRLHVESETGEGKQPGNNQSTKNDDHRQHREKELKLEYFKMLSDRLKNYDHIFLFGSTTAKDELFNSLKSDKRFREKTINVKVAARLTENQMVAEVRRFFNL